MNDFRFPPRMNAGACVVLVGVVSVLARPALAQSSQPEALAAVRAAVASEMQNATADKSVWMYRDEDNVPEKRAVYEAIETPRGELRKMVLLDGRPLTPAEQQAEADRIRKYVQDQAEQAKSRKASSHDEAQASELLKMLPDAFLWKVQSDSPEAITLAFVPNPNFNPPDTQARVLGAMGGTMVVSHENNRIRTLRGKLLTDIIFGLAIFGKLDKGGTFDVERRVVGNGRWQITETHVHIGGHALFFKTIGSQEDEVKTEWRPSPCATLEEAAKVLGVM
jgi:hypothetical protein